ncbi:MAG: beta-ribofuranosylaminobenzene 5'-phosphate synthase family protein [Candidatus Nezhaarchaeales archaeon]
MRLRVWVSAPSRLHFGMINPIGVEGRLYISLGVGIEEPRTVVEAEPADELIVEGAQKRLAQRFAERTSKAFGIYQGKIKVHSAAPRHVGLGSTTQLALSVAYALLTLNRVDESVPTVSKALGLGKQSGIGTYVFERGGFILDGGVEKVRGSFPPLILRLNVPEWWHFVVTIPIGRGVSGRAEKEAFASLKPSIESEKLVGKAASITLCKLLPALADEDLEAFGKALRELQEVVGMMFSQAQGGTYNMLSAKVIEVLKNIGVEGYGQSSWGPAVYAVTSDDKAEAVANKIKRRLKMKARIFIVKADNQGANITVTQ